MYCELIPAPVIILIDLLLSLSLDYHSLMYSIHDPNRCLDLRRFQMARSQLPRPMPHS